MKETKVKKRKRSNAKAYTARTIFVICSICIMLITGYFSFSFYNKNNSWLEECINNGIMIESNFSYYGWIGLLLLILLTTEVVIFGYLCNRIRIMDRKKSILDLAIEHVELR